MCLALETAGKICRRLLACHGNDIKCGEAIWCTDTQSYFLCMYKAKYDHCDPTIIPQPAAMQHM